MTTAKTAVSLSEEVLLLVRKRVRAGRAKSVSAYVNEAVDEKVRRDELAELLDELDGDRGAPGKAAKTWAKRVLARSS